MLTDPMRKYLENPNEYNKKVQAVYNRRLREYTIQALKDLALIVEKLPEKRQVKIFSVENTGPFLRKLFSLESDDVAKRRKRVIGLWDAIFRAMDATYGLKLVGRKVWSALTIQRDANLRAIYYATLFHES